MKKNKFTLRRRTHYLAVTLAGFALMASMLALQRFPTRQ